MPEQSTAGLAVYESFKLAVTALVLPPGGPVVLVVLGVLLWRRRPRLARTLCATGAALLWLASLPIVTGAAVSLLGGGQALDVEQAKKADAIVILGGGVRSQAIEYDGDTLGRLTLERVRYGARLARTTGLPVLVTGGSADSDVRPEAELMREALATEYGVKARWIDDRARNTQQNAVNAAAILRPERKDRVILVMHGFDVRRATRQFELAGLTVIPAPTHVPRWTELAAADFLPNAAALYSFHFAAYEAIALIRDWVADRR